MTISDYPIFRPCFNHVLFFNENIKFYNLLFKFSINFAKFNHLRHRELAAGENFLKKLLFSYQIYVILIKFTPFLNPTESGTPDSESGTPSWGTSVPCPTTMCWSLSFDRYKYCHDELKYDILGLTELHNIQTQDKCIPG